MKLFSLFAILAASILAVCATHLETNAARFARGLPPLPPHRRSTPVAGPSFYAAGLLYTDSFIVQLPGEALLLEPRVVRATLVLFNAAPPSTAQTILPCPASSAFWVLYLIRQPWLVCNALL
jgi:hypothetical protein